MIHYDSTWQAARAMPGWLHDIGQTLTHLWANHP